MPEVTGKSRHAGPAVRMLSWEDTAREMAANDEDWIAWDLAGGDGLDDTGWSSVEC